MKRAMILIPIAVLLALTLAASTVAACVEREQGHPMCRSWSIVPVNATQTGAPLSFSPETGINQGGILHVYATTGGNVKLYIPAGSASWLALVSSSNLTVIINTKTGKGIVHFDMTWTNTGGDGTFEGQVNGKIIDYTYDTTTTPIKFGWAGSVHAVFQGSGVFEGQTLFLQGTRTRTGPATFTGLTWEGFLLER